MWTWALKIKDKYLEGILLKSLTHPKCVESEKIPEWTMEQIIIECVGKGRRDSKEL